MPPVLQTPNGGSFRRGIALYLTIAAISGVARAATGPQIIGLRVGSIDAEKAGIVVLIAPSTAGKCVGQFRGSLSFFKDAPGVPIAGTFSAGPAACEMPASIFWATVPEGAVQGIANDLLTVRFRGERIEGRKVRKVDWGAPVARAAVQLPEPIQVTLRRFATTKDMHLGPTGLSTTTVNAEFVVRSPLRFHLRVMQVRCELEIAGKTVASGLKENFLIFGGRPNQVTFPFTLNNKAMLAAAGNSLAKGVKVEGRLSGVTRLRFPGGDVEFPVEYPIMISLY